MGRLQEISRMVRALCKGEGKQGGRREVEEEHRLLTTGNYTLP